MTEQLHFSELWPHWPELLAGLWVTVQLTVLATIGGLAIGILGAAIRSGRPGMLSRVWGGYVEIIRNTPFVVQLFFIVFGLPNLGLKMTAGEAALLAMMVNLGRSDALHQRLSAGYLVRQHSRAAERPVGSLALSRAELRPDPVPGGGAASAAHCYRADRRVRRTGDQRHGAGIDYRLCGADQGRDDADQRHLSAI